MGKLKRFIKLGPKILLKKIVGYEEIYTIGIRHRGSSDPYKRIPYDKKYWYADPLTFKHDNRWYLFTEAFDRELSIGRIAVSSIDDNGNITSPEIIIKENYHMSFPYVFQWNGGIYLIPETSENNTINVYKCTHFPYEWKMQAQLPTEEGFVDAVVDIINVSRLSLLGSITNPGNPLLVSYKKYYILQESNQFKLEQDNDVPISWNLMDRNAGKPVMFSDKMMQPTQESSETDYGINICFRELGGDVVPKKAANTIIKVNETDFGPGIKEKNKIGVHTYSLTDDYEILDLRYYKFSLDTNLRRIKHIIRRNGR